MLAKEVKTILSSFVEYASKLTEQPIIKSVTSLIAGLLFTIFGPWTDTFTALLIVTVLDTVTGVWQARNEGSLKASVLRDKTFVKACVYLILLALGYQVQKATQSVAFVSEMALQLFTVYLMLGEVISTLQHLESISGRRFKLLSPKEGIEEILKARLSQEQISREGNANVNREG
jgi:phage-related holin